MWISVSLFIPIYFPLSALLKLLLPVNEMAWRAGHIYTTLVGNRDFTAYTKPQPPVVVRLVWEKQDIFYVLLVCHKSLHDVMLLFHVFMNAKVYIKCRNSQDIFLIRIDGLHAGTLIKSEQTHLGKKKQKKWKPQTHDKLLELLIKVIFLK